MVEHKTWVLIFSRSFFWKCSHYKKSWARYDNKYTSGLHVKYRYLCLVSMKLEFSRQIFNKCSDTKFNDNPSSWNRQTDMTKLTVAFRNFTNASKNFHLLAGKTPQCQEICCDVTASGNMEFLVIALAFTKNSVKTSHIYHHHWNILINLSCRFMKSAVC